MDLAVSGHGSDPFEALFITLSNAISFQPKLLMPKYANMTDALYLVLDFSGVRLVGEQRDKHVAIFSIAVLSANPAFPQLTERLEQANCVPTDAP